MTIIFQSTTNKEIFSYDIEDKTPSSIYYEFDIELKDMKDGEYEYLLIENPDGLMVVSNTNNVFESELGDPVIIVAENLPLTAAEKILISYMGETFPKEVLAFGLCRIGDYKTSKTEYNKQTKYVTYERKYE